MQRPYPYRIAKIPRLARFFRDDQPQRQIGDDAREPTWQRGQDKTQPKPGGADPKEFAQSPTDASHHLIAARAAQWN
jgi:hypothetical protein